MAFVKRVNILILLSCMFLHSEPATSRIYFTRCGLAGFTCIVNSGRHKIFYQCPPAQNDTTFYIWQFRSPVNTESLTIRNCSILRLSFQCTNENKPITDLLIANIENLVIIKSSFTHNPKTIVFENITKIDYIPEDSFSQIKRKFPIAGCINPYADLENIYFRNVNVGFISPKAFNDLKNFHNFSWHYVNIERMQHLAVEIDFTEKGNFSVRNSNIDVCEHSSFKITGPEALFTENKFVDIHAGAINGTIGAFTFSSNNVNNIQSYGISILSETVRFLDNRFEYLRAGAFEKISPGLLQNSRINFGSLKFVYKFTHNTVNFMDSASVNPDMQAYEKVASEIIFHRNAFFCSCENLGWILSGVGYGYNAALLKNFYETIMELENKNFCSYTTCDLPISCIYKFLDNNKQCLTNLTAENLCDMKAEIKKYVTTQFTTSPIQNLHVSKSMSHHILNSDLLISLGVIILYMFDV